MSKLLSCEQTAHYHTKAADIAFQNGDTYHAQGHLKAAQAANYGNREKYLQIVQHYRIERYDSCWQAQRNLEAA